MRKSKYYYLFISFHGNEELGFIQDGPKTRKFIKYYLIPQIHEMWDHCYKRQGHLSIFYDDDEISGNIEDDILSGILRLPVMILKREKENHIHAKCCGLSSILFPPSKSHKSLFFYRDFNRYSFFLYILPISQI